MQIDCEVIDTRLLHVKSRSIPDHLKHTKEDLNNVNNDNNITSQNDTNNSRSNSNADSDSDAINTKLYKPYFLKNAPLKANIDRLYSEKVKKVFKYT